MKGPEVLVVAYTLARPFGPGTVEACRSRAFQALARALRLMAHRADFRFLVDGAGAIARYRSLRPEDRGLDAAMRAGRLMVGRSWYAMGPWPTAGEEMVRSLQAARAATGAAAEPAFIVADGRVPAQLPQLMRLTGAGETVIVPGSGGGGRLIGLDGTAVAAVGLDGTAAVEALAGRDAAAARDAGKEIARRAASGGAVFGWGGALWQPSSEALEALAARAEEAGLSLRFASAADLASSPPGRALGPERAVSSEEALFPDMVPAAVACAHGLLLAERAAALSVAMGVARPAPEDGWPALLEAQDAALSGTADASKRGELASRLSAIAWAANGARGDAEGRLAGRAAAGEGPPGTLPIVVFNPSAYRRREPVDAHVVFYGETAAERFERYELYKVVDEAGTPVAVQEIAGKQVQTAEVEIRFLADVPPLGYRTYYLVPRPEEIERAVPIQAPGEMAPDFAEPAFTVEDVEDRVSVPFRGIRIGRRFDAGAYSLDVDEVTGRIRIADRRSARAAVDGLHLAAFEVGLDRGLEAAEETGRRFEAAVDFADLEVSGEVIATLLVKGRVMTSPFSLRLGLCGSVDFVDVDLRVSWRDERPARLRLVFPMAGQGAIHHGVPFGSAAAAWDGVGRLCAGWVAVDGDGAGVAIGSDRQAFSFADGQVRSEVLYSTVDPASYTYHRVWRRYPEETRCRYRVRSYAGDFISGRAWQESAAFAEPLAARVVYDRDSPRDLPATGSALALEGDGIVASAFLPGPEANTALLRAFETAGRRASSRLSGGRIGRVEEVDLRGEVLCEVDPHEVTFEPFEIRTFRIVFERGP